MKYAHLTKFEGGGAVTAAYQYSNDNDWKNSDHVIVALAFCSPSDQFSKQTGRNKAGGRFTQGAVHKVELNGEGVHTAISDFLFQDFDVHSTVLVEELNANILDFSDFEDEASYDEAVDQYVVTNRACIAPFWLLEEFLLNYEEYSCSTIAEMINACQCTSCECEEPEQEKVDTPAQFY